MTSLRWILCILFIPGWILSWSIKICQVACLWRITLCHHTHQIQIIRRSMYDEEINDNSLLLPELEYLFLPTPIGMVPMDRYMWAQWLVAHIRQLFGTLLLMLAPTGQHVVNCRWAVADSMLTVQFQENVLLTDLLDNVCILNGLWFA